MIYYLDTSVAMKRLADEPESRAFTRRVRRGAATRELAASWLLQAELHYAAGRHPDDIDPDAVGIVRRRRFSGRAPGLIEMPGGTSYEPAGSAVFAALGRRGGVRIVDRLVDRRLRLAGAMPHALIDL